LVALENKLQLAKQTQLEQLLFNKRNKENKRIKRNGPSQWPKL